MYSAGIAALSAERYDTLNAALFAPVQNNNRRADSEPAVVPTIEALTEVVEQFKRLPDMANKYVPRSEHLFKKLQPPLEDLLFFGRKYEVLFDEFEILLALSFSDARDEDPKQQVWGPPGRFAWKERGRLRDDPVYTKFIQAAKRNGPHWRALEAGMFKGSEQRFREIADGYGQVLSQVNWW
jgi:hypothetical protein